MNAAIVPFSGLDGRWDASHQILLQEHKELAETLFAMLSGEELANLARSLPFDQAAADAVWPRPGRSMTPSALATLVGDGLGTTAGSTQRKRNLCVYVAAAAQFGVSKMLEEVVRLSQMKLEKVEQVKALLNHPRLKDVEPWQKAMKRSNGNAQG